MFEMIRLRQLKTEFVADLSRNNVITKQAAPRREGDV